MIGGIGTFQKSEKNLANPRLNKEYPGIPRFFFRFWRGGVQEIILGKIRFCGIKTFSKSEKKPCKSQVNKKVPGNFKVFFENNGFRRSY